MLAPSAELSDIAGAVRRRNEKQIPHQNEQAEWQAASKQIPVPQTLIACEQHAEFEATSGE